MSREEIIDKIINEIKEKYSEISITNNKDHYALKINYKNKKRVVAEIYKKRNKSDIRICFNSNDSNLNNSSKTQNFPMNKEYWINIDSFNSIMFIKVKNYIEKSIENIKNLM